MKTDLHFSSERQDWGTPWEIAFPLRQEFDLMLDVCASDENYKCKFWFSEETNGLKVDWLASRCWMNPPYGKELSKWVQKAWDEAGLGCLVVCLLPARTDTKWWGIFWDHDKHKMRHEGDELRFVKGRIKFEGAENSAPFPSAIVILKPRSE